jgi:azurin
MENLRKAVSATVLLGAPVLPLAAHARKGGDYKYLCTFPGHNPLMHGVFKLG